MYGREDNMKGWRNMSGLCSDERSEEKLKIKYILKPIQILENPTLDLTSSETGIQTFGDGGSDS